MEFSIEYIFAILLFISTIGILLLGFPVAFTLGGVALLFALIGAYTYTFHFHDLGAFPSRIYAIMTQESLLAIPLFIFMGLLLENSGISEDLLENVSRLLGSLRGGLGVSVFLVGGLLAASTGIVGATVIAMGLISLPTMLKHRYKPELASGIVLAAGTLGQIVPPSIILIVLGDQISSAYQQALSQMGDYTGASISIGDLFIGAIIPALVLIVFYILYVFITALLRPNFVPTLSKSQDKLKSFSMRQILELVVLPVSLIVAVLGSILIGLASSTEAASVGVMGAFALSLYRRKLEMNQLKKVLIQSAKITSMIYMILIGASLFSLVFRGFGGDELVHYILVNLPGGKWFALTVVMLLIFFLGFFLDFFEITFIVVPIVVPSLIIMGFHPLWLGILIALNLQSSFLTPPLGFSLFYLRSVAPPSIPTKTIYKGAIPFICLQLSVLILVILFPDLALWLPTKIYD